MIQKLTSGQCSYSVVVSDSSNINSDFQFEKLNVSHFFLFSPLLNILTAALNYNILARLIEISKSWSETNRAFDKDLSSSNSRP